MEERTCSNASCERLVRFRWVTIQEKSPRWSEKCDAQCKSTQTLARCWCGIRRRLGTALPTGGSQQMKKALRHSRSHGRAARLPLPGRASTRVSLEEEESRRAEDGDDGYWNERDAIKVIDDTLGVRGLNRDNVANDGWHWFEAQCFPIDHCVQHHSHLRAEIEIIK